MWLNIICKGLFSTWCGITLWVSSGSVSSFLPSSRWPSLEPWSPTTSQGKKEVTGIKMDFITWKAWCCLCCHVYFLDYIISIMSSPCVIRNKSQMPATPILSSMARTIRYHLGTLAKGSFIITLVKIPRLILTYIHSQLKGKVSCEIMQRSF